MKEISREQATQISELISELNIQKDGIEALQDEVNDKIGELNEKIQRYNNVLKNIDGMATQVVEDMQSYFGSQSDPWKEKHGDQYEEWMGQWENYDASAVPTIDDVAVDELDHGEMLNELPLSPE